MQVVCFKDVFLKNDLAAFCVTLCVAHLRVGIAIQ